MMILISLAVAGIVLLILELFLPGAVAGIVGILCIIAATVMAFNRFGPEIGFYILATEIVLGIAAFLLWVKYFPNSFIGKFFSLKEAPSKSSAPEELARLVGTIGKTVSPLRPSGVANFNGQRHDVVSEGSHIESGKDIKIVKVEGARIVVRLVS